MVAVGKDRQSVAGDIAIVTGALDRVGDGVGALDQLLRIDEVVRRLVAVFEYPLPEVALFLRAPAIGEDDRQGGGLK